jgi:hypothetical protein
VTEGWKVGRRGARWRGEEVRIFDLMRLLMSPVAMLWKQKLRISVLN